MYFYIGIGIIVLAIIAFFYYYRTKNVEAFADLSGVVVDLSGRAYPIWKCEFKRDKVGDMDSELFREWFFAFANAVGCNLHIENLYGVNNHHIVESCFKGLARAFRQAITIDERKKGAVASTKGVL